MATLQEILGGPANRSRVVDDTVRLIDGEMGRKKGLKAMPLKAGYKLVKGFRPGFVRGCVEYLLDDFCAKLDPFYQTWTASPAEGRPSLTEALRREEHKVSDALLGVTDVRAERSKNRGIRKMYFKLRPIAQSHVREALPGLGRTIEPYLKAHAEAAATSPAKDA